MRFGIFFELSVPPPFGRAEEQRVYREALEQAVLADELGFDSVWAVEHHFLEGYSHCSAPEVFLTALCDDVVAKRGGVPDVAGPLDQRAAWLTGRPHQLSEAPALAAWL